MTIKDFEKIALYYHETEFIVPEDNAVRIFSRHLPKSQVFRNLYIYAQIEESDLNVPKINKVFPVDNERWGILEQNIHGKSLFVEINENRDSYDEYLEALIELQTAVYGTKIYDLFSHKSIVKAQISSLNILSKEKKDSLIEILNNLPDDNKTIHGNFSPECVITDKNDTLFITNWVSAACGSIAGDAAMTYLNLFNLSTETAENYLKLFKEKTDCEIELIRKWIPLMAAAQLSMGAISTLQQAFLMTWLDIDEKDDLSDMF